MEALLTAWRETRAPGLADAIDRLTTAAPVTGATVTARTKAWLALARRGMDLPTLLATPWPNTWQKTLPLVEALAEVPDDPRLAMALAKLACDERYATPTSGKFWEAVLNRLAGLRDVRVLPRLEAMVPRLRAPADRHLARALVALREVVPGEVPAALAATLVAPVARTEDELVAAILADPDNRALRAVYGDWLGECGDPRGELIALQLSPRDTEARERTLIKQHARAWAGSLAEHFEDEGLCFDDGLFSGGSVRIRAGANVAQMVADPRWALVRSLAAGDSELLLGLVARPELRSLRWIYGLPARPAARLESPRITLLCIIAPYPGELDATYAQLPNLNAIGVSLGNEGPAVSHWLETAPVLERIERLMIRQTGSSLAIAALARRAGVLRELEIVANGREPIAREPGWRVRLRRDQAPGPFTSVSAHYHAGGPRRGFTDLANVLQRIPPEWPREIQVTCERMPTLATTERAALVAAVARFTEATHVTVPWSEAAPVIARPTGVPLEIQLDGGGRRAFPTIWKLVEELGHRYDTFTVNRTTTVRRLAPEPAERAASWVDKPGTRDIAFKRDGVGSLTLHLDHFTRTSLALALDRPVEDFVAWFARFVETTEARAGRCGIEAHEEPAQPYDLRPFVATPPAGWLTVFGRDVVPFLPVDEVRALAALPELAELSAIRTREALVLRRGREPRAVDAATLAAASRGLRTILGTHATAKLGYDLHARARALLGPVTASLGLAEAFDPAAPFVARFARDNGDELRIELVDLLATTKAKIALHRRGHYDIIRGLGDDHAMAAETRAQLDAALAEAARRAAAEAPAWFSRT